MKLFEMANLFPKRGITIDRLERIKREGSPTYPYQFPATAPAGAVTIELDRQFPTSKKYSPLDYVEIVNNEAAIPIQITINARETRYCPPGTIRTIKGTGVAIRTITITNLHAADTNTLGLIRLTFQKEPMTIDKWSQNQQ